MLARLIGEDIQLIWLPGSNLWAIKMDPSQIDQILANLIVNARDAIAGVGKITIETENVAFNQAYCNDHAGFLPGDYVMLAISDNGCGMDKDIMAHIFEPFFTTKTVGHGTGLGLATVYGIVKQNNGFINVYSEPRKGTTFKIYLPRFMSDNNESRAILPTEIPQGGKETILLVEDETTVLKMSKRMLDTLGYTVLVANTPSQAIHLTQSHADAIDLLITDVVMPEMNGRDLAKHLKTIQPDLKILFMSGYTADVIAHHGVLEKGVSFISKPFSMEELATKVRQTIEQV
jgi:CheY-like chemotaxis protein